MPLNVQLVNAQVKDPQSGQMTPAGLIGSDAISTINTAKNQAIAAVQQKGEETLQSIPDDYTALSNEVDDVKTQISDVVGNVIYEYTKDKSISNTDVPNQATEVNWESVAVVCQAGDVFCVKGTGGNNTRLWMFADSNGSILTQSAGGLTANNFVTIVAPANAHYLCCNSRYTGSKGALIKNSYVRYDIQEIRTDIENIDKKMLLYGENSKTVHVSANNTHSATADKINVDIVGGEKFALCFSRTYNNSIEFYAFDENNNPSRLLSTSKKSGSLIAIAESNIKSVGISVSSTENADDYTFGVSANNTSIFQIYKNADDLNAVGNYPNKTVHVNANSTHSATRDKLAVDIPSGKMFALFYDRAYTNTIEFYAFDANNNYTKIGTSGLKYGYFVFAALTNYEYIGITVTSNTSADDYKFAIAIEGTPFYDIYYNNNLVENIDSTYNCAPKVSQFVSLYINAGVSDSFIFFTDPHLLKNGNTTDFIPEFEKRTSIIKAFFEKTSTECMICGGDWLEWDDTPVNALYKLNLMTGRMKEICPAHYFPILGNHDTNYQGTEVDGVKALSQDVLNSIMFPYQRKAYYSFEMNHATGYVLDTGIDTTSAMNEYRWAQIDWLANELLENDPQHSAIYCHIVWNVPASTSITPMMDNLQELLGAYNAHSTITLNGISYDFTSCSGKVGYVLGGHLHEDRYDIENYSVPFIVRKNVRASNNVPTFDLVLVDWENGKLYFVRVGSGESGFEEEFNI